MQEIAASTQRENVSNLQDEGKASREGRTLQSKYIRTQSSQKDEPDPHHEEPQEAIVHDGAVLLAVEPDEGRHPEPSSPRR